jgi:cellulose synthase/poly-beta-1,6-N-acetylglucosamine synthase-like glycosyltransferase
MVLKVMTISIAMVLQCAYALQLLWYRGKRKGKTTHPTYPAPLLSIVIPFRNEVQHLPALLDKLHQLPVEIDVYWIDDHSDDQGQTWLSDNITTHHILLKNKGQGKKAALTTGIEKIPESHWILTIDADAQLSDHWWKNIQHQFNPECALIVFPITMLTGKKWVAIFQHMEFSFFQILTEGSILRQRAQLSNGAHLAFQKKYYSQVNGYSSHENISSGDDQFLLAAFRKKGWNIGWASIAPETISIAPLSTWKALLSQRVRWAGKSKALEMVDMKLLAFTTAISNTITLYAYILLIFQPIQISSIPLLLLVLIKIFVEFEIFRMLKKRPHFITLLFLIIYPFWVFAVGLSVLFLKQEWKGRAIRN